MQTYYSLWERVKAATYLAYYVAIAASLVYAIATQQITALYVTLALSALAVVVMFVYFMYMFVLITAMHIEELVNVVRNK